MPELLAHDMPAEDIFDRRYGLSDSAAARVRGGARIFASLALTCLMAVPQSILIRLGGWGKIWLARVYWAGICRILGLKVSVTGTLAARKRDAKSVRRGEKPVIFVANHCSWLDIPVVGGAFPTVFVAKQQIADWPVIGTLARLGRTIFVSRQRNNTGKELSDMSSRLQVGDNLILFPEGTSSDGRDVLPFMSSFFAIAKPSDRIDSSMRPPEVLIQPVSIVYDGLNGFDVGREDCDVFAWYGEMDLAPHIWQVTRWKSMHASVVLHPPVDPSDYPDRKALATAIHAIVSAGVHDLRGGQTPKVEAQSVREETQQTSPPKVSQLRELV